MGRGKEGDPGGGQGGGGKKKPAKNRKEGDEEEVDARTMAEVEVGKRLELLEIADSPRARRTATGSGGLPQFV